eukprot:1186748-Prorocentrum_minimum.AAC.2
MAKPEEAWLLAINRERRAGQAASGAVTIPMLRSGDHPNVNKLQRASKRGLCRRRQGSGGMGAPAGEPLGGDRRPPPGLPSSTRIAFGSGVYRLASRGARLSRRAGVGS